MCRYVHVKSSLKIPIFFRWEKLILINPTSRDFVFFWKKISFGGFTTDILFFFLRVAGVKKLVNCNLDWTILINWTWKKRTCSGVYGNCRMHGRANMNVEQVGRCRELSNRFFTVWYLIIAAGFPFPISFYMILQESIN